MPGPFDYLQDGSYVPPFLAEPPPSAPPPFLAPEQVGAVPGFGNQQLTAPEPVPAFLQQAQQEPQQAAPSFPVGPGERVKVRTSQSGYAPPTYTPRDPMAPLVKAEQGVRQAADQQAAGIERMGQLEADYDENVTKWELDQKAQILADSEADRAEIAGQFETERQGQLARIQQTIAEIPSRDPKRWWKNMDSFQQSSAYMAAAIDGYLNPGGANGAVEQANKLAEADAYAQMSDIETAQKKVGYEQTAYERLLGEHEFRRQAFMEAKAYKLESLAVATEQRGMTFKSPITQQKYAMEANKIRAESQKTLADLANQMSQRLDAGAERALRERMQKREHAFEAAKQKAAAAAKGVETAGQNLLADPATGKNWVITKQTADREGRLKNWSDKGEGISTYSNMLTGASGTGGLKRYAALMSKLGRTYSGPGANTAAVASERQQTRAEMLGLREQLIADYRHGLYGAALTKEEAKNFEAMIPPPEGLTGPTSTKTLESFIKTKAGEAQGNFINPLGIADESGKPVDLVKEWGTIEATHENTAYLDAGDLVASGNAVARGAEMIPTEDRPTADDGAVNLGRASAPRALENPAGRAQAQMLELRAKELVNRSKNYASRSGMTPEVGAQALESLKQWAATASQVGATDVADRIMAQAADLEKQLTAETSDLSSLGLQGYTPGFQRR